MLGFTFFALLKSSEKQICMHNRHKSLQYQYASNKLKLVDRCKCNNNLKILSSTKKDFQDKRILTRTTMPGNIFSNYILNEKIWNFNAMREELCKIERKFIGKKLTWQNIEKTTILDDKFKNGNVQNIFQNRICLESLNSSKCISNFQESKTNGKFSKEVEVIKENKSLFSNKNNNNVLRTDIRNYATNADITNEVKISKERGRKRKQITQEKNKIADPINITNLNLEDSIVQNNNNDPVFDKLIDTLSVKSKIITPIIQESVEHKTNELILPPEIKIEQCVQKKTSEECKLLKPINVSEKDILKLKKQFPFPKNNLHNIFAMISQQLNNKSLHLTPTYTLIKSSKSRTSWECMYHLKWPEDVVFTKTAVTKRDASEKAALLVLHYLKINNKIKNDNQPLLGNELAECETKLVKLKTLSFNTSIINRLKNISTFYEKHVSSLLVQNMDVDKPISRSEDFESSWPENNRKVYNFRDLQYYSTKEPVVLPISDFKNNIINAIQNNQVVIIKGEPGCGKSTRVPQYVLEGWAKEAAESNNNNTQDCKIVVTQPRRIAALSLAERVARERQETVGNTVGFQVRLKSNFNKRTGHILYCTTGILLRRLQSDPKLVDCSHIILDEAHERDVNTDLLINLLRYAIKLNPNLKLIVMSATINTDVFQTYFNNAPIVNIPGFTYPVKINYLDESKNLDKTMKMCDSKEPTVINDEVVKLIRYIHKNRDEGAILCFLPGWDDIVKIRNLLAEDYSNDKVVLCLHSRLQDDEQRKIFSKPPPGIRKIILATNIAETSVTIDDVVYVIDSGIQKEKRFDVEKGIDCIDNHWISKASMAQRKGRAGRCQPGESFHLYPKDKYDNFIDYSVPEILRTSLTKIVLDSKVYSNNMKALDFMNQLLTPPDNIATLRAVEELKDLKLLDENEDLTSLGRTLSDFQLEPRLGKALINSVVYKCVTPVVDIVTLFSSEMELFASGLTDKDSINRRKKEFSRNSDHLSLMRIFEKWLELKENDNYMASRFCNDNKLVEHKLSTIQKLRDIHYNYLHRGLHNILPVSDEYSDNDELVKGVLLSGVGTVLQHRNYDIVKGRSVKKNVLLTRNNHKATITSESVNFKRGVFPSSHLLYINETRSNIRRITVVRETSLISTLAVLLFKNNELVIKDLPKNKFSDEIKSEDQVILSLENTNIEFIIDRSEAEVLKRCKEDLSSCYEYYVQQLTKGAKYDKSLNASWDEILQLLHAVLNVSTVSS